MREKLVKLAKKWEKDYGVMPQIISAVSEYDAAMFVGMKEKQYSDEMQNVSAVRKGYDFEYNGKRYQIKANRPSGKKGSTITRAGKPRNTDFDELIWIEYNQDFTIKGAWQVSVSVYRKKMQHLKYLSPKDYQKNGKSLK
ncbi:MAG: hypothetical protein KDK41_14110 [Leptospiraceae bacterium]|nr:hypothetical protein [Leptospiraceae bacterium]